MAQFTETQLLPLNEIVRAGMTRHQVPGCAIGVVHGGRRYLASYGVTSVENPLEVTPGTLFQIGSITKTFTGLALAMLADEGKVDFDAPVRRYLPDFRVQDEAASAAVTVRHLVTHTSGWVGDIFRDTGQGDDALARYVASLANVPQQFAPGTMWSYNNAAFAVAGRVIEAISGAPVEQFLVERILKPLGMGKTRIMARDVITQRTVSGHFWGGERGAQVANPWWKTRGSNAVGSIVSSVEEMCCYLRFHLAGTGVTEDGSRLLSAEALRATHLSQAPAGGAYSGVGTAWLLRRVQGREFFGHGGATVGQMAQCIIVPDSDLALIVLTNGQRGDGLCAAVSEWILREFAQIEPEEQATIALTPEERSAYAGRYRAALTHVEVAVADDGLSLQTIPQGGYPLEGSPPPPAPPPARARFVGADRIAIANDLADDATAEFLRDRTGKMEWLLVGGRLHRRD